MNTWQRSRRWAMKREASNRQATKTVTLVGMKMKTLFFYIVHRNAYFSPLFTFFLSNFVLFYKTSFEVSVVVRYFGNVVVFVNMLPWHIRSEFQMKMKKFSWNLKRNKNCFRSRELFPFCTLHFASQFSHVSLWKRLMFLFFRWVSSGNLMEWLRT